MDRSSPCLVDAEYSHQISALLTPPSHHSVQEYYDELLETTQCRGIGVKQNHEYGKGSSSDVASFKWSPNSITKTCIYAKQEFKEGELILKDQMLVAAQHSSNKVDCLVCSYCFRYTGSIEVQIGRKLYLQGLRLSAEKERDCPTSYHTSDGIFHTDLSDEGETCVINDADGIGSSSEHPKDESLPAEVLETLMNGDLSLPYANQFVLPSTVPCLGGCGEEHYCSKLCAESDWASFHSLLCTGDGSDSSRKTAILKFIQHAKSTNDIFILAAKVISFTILRFNKLKKAHLEKGKDVLLDGIDGSSFALLLEAFKPVSMGFKKRWWDCIALPDDVDPCNELPFRTHIRDLAFASLQLLKQAIFTRECAPLFSLEIYGHIIGMFELNNLDLVVASPVEDYFIYIDDLPFPEKEEAERCTQPFLDALGDEYSVCCQGSAFFPLQSCMNHSCHPNAKAFKRDEDRDGQATIIAVRSISIGEEINISYIDGDLPYEERQMQLADYGFTCRCPRCLEERP